MKIKVPRAPEKVRGQRTATTLIVAVSEFANACAKQGWTGFEMLIVVSILRHAIRDAMETHDKPQFIVQAEQIAWENRTAIWFAKDLGVPR